MNPTRDLEHRPREDIDHPESVRWRRAPPPILADPRGGVQAHPRLLPQTPHVHECAVRQSHGRCKPSDAHPYSTPSRSRCPRSFARGGREPGPVRWRPKAPANLVRGLHIQEACAQKLKPPPGPDFRPPGFVESLGVPVLSTELRARTRTCEYDSVLPQNGGRFLAIRHRREWRSSESLAPD